MAAWVDMLAVVFPFERGFMKDLAPQLRTAFVGHPLLDHPELHEGREQKAEPALEEDGPMVGILPGSREGEISRILPGMFQAACIMQKERPELRFVLPLAPGLSNDVIEPYLDKAPRSLAVLTGRADAVMRKSRVLMVTSGTATLETALAGSPLLVVYKTGWLNYVLARWLVKIEHIAMPNLIAGHKLVPEFIQDQADPAKMADTALRLLEDGPERAKMMQGLAEIKARMGGPGASRKVAELARNLITETTGA
jgi:lipid-A-disaccharide synthase